MAMTTLHGDQITVLSLQELCRFSHAEEAWVIELVEHGVLTPEGDRTPDWQFQGKCIIRAKKALRLNRDLGVNAAGVALVLDLLEERDAALARLAQYEPL